MPTSSSTFSAAEQSLGYMFQSRFALLLALRLPETEAIHIERNDDVEFVSESGTVVTLASLKHKAVGDRLTDLSNDFWKSVRVWLAYYASSGRTGSTGRFLLFSTASIAPDSFLNKFVGAGEDDSVKTEAATNALSTSESVALSKIRTELMVLADEEKDDFYGRINIFPNTSRIEDVPKMMDKTLRTVRREFRSAIFERLEGWWNDIVVQMLTGERREPIRVQSVSDKLAALADEYKIDNLPITFRNQTPEALDARSDPRIFVDQMRVLDLPDKRIQLAIIDYYRAFEQRSSWARENLLVAGEVEQYEDRLVEEWDRYRTIICEDITDDTHEDACRHAGRELYLWAETKTGDLRIRERVTEQYVVRGAFHILANSNPVPRVHWHPRFLRRLAELFGVAA